jgi:2-polyprenyl-6-methoxyphenol hydroxylase-like FAD-dependent oxidoreductase
MTSISQYQRSSRRDCQVLVVGAGPTSLVLACGLLAHGIRARIIDKGDGVVPQTRALGIHARTLEVFDMMGLAERFIEHGQVVRRFHMYTDGKTLVRLELARNGSAFGFKLDVPRDATEVILRQRISELGGSVEQGTEFSDLSVDPGGVTATVIAPGGAVRTITADYVVGADGAHSRVRSELGLDFRGYPYTQDWLLADVHLDWSRPDDEMHAFFRRDGRPRPGSAENVYLLRPDGYVAVCGSVTRPDSLLDYLHRLFGTTRARQSWPRFGGESGAGCLLCGDRGALYPGSFRRRL